MKNLFISVRAPETPEASVPKKRGRKASSKTVEIDSPVAVRDEVKPTGKFIKKDAKKSREDKIESMKESEVEPDEISPIEEDPTGKFIEISINPINNK